MRSSPALVALLFVGLVTVLSGGATAAWAGVPDDATEELLGLAHEDDPNCHTGHPGTVAACSEGCWRHYYYVAGHKVFEYHIPC